MTSTSTSPAIDHAHGHELLQRFIRGDALIGIMPNAQAMLLEMTAALRRAANAGHAEAFYDLGQCNAAVLVAIGAFDGVYDEVEPTWSPEAKAVVDDNAALQTALRCFFEAARLGHRHAALAFANWTRHANEAAQRTAIAVLTSLSSDVDDTTRGTELCQLGYVHTWLKQHALAVPALQKAAEFGNGNAIFELSIVYGQGLGVDVDPVAAQAWLDRAAAANHPRALYNLGAAWASGRADDEGIPDFDKAATYYERAAEQGNGRAAAMLAVMILQEDIEGTTATASSWLDAADEAGFDVESLLEACELDDPRS